MTDLQTLERRAFLDRGRGGATIEPLESRRLLAVFIADRVVHVDGTSGNDTILTEGGRFPSEEITVTLNGATSTFHQDDFDRVLVRGFAGNDSLTDRAGYATRFEGGDGNDSVGTSNSEGSDFATVSGGAGNDVVRFGADAGTTAEDLTPFDGDAGRDKIIFTSVVADLDLRQFPTVEDAEIRHGTLTGNSLNNYLTITAYGSMFGGDGNDTLDGSRLFEDPDFTLSGENGNDRLIGANVPASSLPTRLNGGAGNDTLVSGSSPEVLSGGSGLDTLA